MAYKGTLLFVSHDRRFANNIADNIMLIEDAKVEQLKQVMVITKNISAYQLNINPEELFEKFKRGDESRNTEGSGLGLSIAKGIMELHGGEMKIEVDGDLFKNILIFNKTIEDN